MSMLIGTRITGWFQRLYLAELRVKEVRERYLMLHIQGLTRSEQAVWWRMCFAAST